MSLLTLFWKLCAGKSHARFDEGGLACSVPYSTCLPLHERFKDGIERIVPNGLTS